MSSARSKVFDTSAILAWLLDETGAKEVQELIEHGGCMSAANWSELKQQVHKRGFDWIAVCNGLEAIGLEVVDVTKLDAELAADIWLPGIPLSLGDRLCLALGQRFKAEVITADTEWTKHADVTLIR